MRMEPNRTTTSENIYKKEKKNNNTINISKSERWESGAEWTYQNGEKILMEDEYTDEDDGGHMFFFNKNIDEDIFVLKDGV